MEYSMNIVIENNTKIEICTKQNDFFRYNVKKNNSFETWKLAVVQSYFKRLTKLLYSNVEKTKAVTAEVRGGEGNTNSFVVNRLC